MNMRRTVIAIVGAAGLAVMAGCASLPSPEVMQKETASFKLPKMPAPGQAMVYVVRPSRMGGFVRFNVFVDDKEVDSEMGYTRGGQYIYFNVAPGDYTVYSKAENWAETTVTAKADEVVFIQQEATTGIIMSRNTIAKIDSLQGKYQVKNLNLGTILKEQK